MRAAYTSFIIFLLCSFNTVYGSNNANILDKSTDINMPSKQAVTTSNEEIENRIISHSPNKKEARNFLIESESLRVQELKTRREKSKAEEAKSTYDAAFWQKKMELLDKEFDEKMNSESKSPSKATNKESPLNNQQLSIANKDDAKDKQVIMLSDFRVSAIIKSGNSFIARLSHNNQQIPAKKGTRLFSDIKVIDVTEKTVELKRKNESLTLHIF